jgi:hypothetical protein
MEFELGRTYSRYKFLDVVARSRSTVVYRVQNTLVQRLELLTALPAGLGTTRMQRNAWSARCASAHASPTRTF